MNERNKRYCLQLTYGQILYIFLGSAIVVGLIIGASLHVTSRFTAVLLQITPEDEQRAVASRQRLALAAQESRPMKRITSNKRSEQLDRSYVSNPSVLARARLPRRNVAGQTILEEVSESDGF